MRSRFLINILLTLVWVALTGSYDRITFVFGFILSFVVIWIIGRDDGSRKYVAIIPRVISFFFFFIYQLVKANIQVAYDVVTPKFYMKPGIVQLPLDARSDLEITLLANFISLTPGTLSLDLSADRKVLYVHAMYVDDRDEFIREIKEGFERKLLQILR